MDEWNFSAGLLNIGAANWKRKAYRLIGEGETIKVRKEKIKIGIPPRLIMGVSRQFSPRWNYGIMAENTFYPDKSLASATLSLNGAVSKIFSTSFSYTAGYKFTNFVAGSRLRFMYGAGLFFVTDYLIQGIRYKRTNRLSAAAGINISTGIINHLSPKKIREKVDKNQELDET